MTHNCVNITYTISRKERINKLLISLNQTVSYCLQAYHGTATKQSCVVLKNPVCKTINKDT